MTSNRNGYAYAALFYWRYATLFRKPRTENDRLAGEQNLRLCAAMHHYPVIRRMALKDLGLLMSENKMEAGHAGRN